MSRERKGREGLSRWDEKRRYGGLLIFSCSNLPVKGTKHPRWRGVVVWGVRGMGVGWGSGWLTGWLAIHRNTFFHFFSFGDVLFLFFIQVDVSCCVCFTLIAGSTGVSTSHARGRHAATNGNQPCLRFLSWQHGHAQTGIISENGYFNIRSLLRSIPGSRCVGYSEKFG